MGGTCPSQYGVVDGVFNPVQRRGKVSRASIVLGW